MGEGLERGFLEVCLYSILGGFIVVVFLVFGRGEYFFKVVRW